MREKKTKDIDTETETERDVIFHHSDPSDSFIHHTPSLFDRGPATPLCFHATEIPRSNIHTSVIPKKESPEKSWQLQSEAFSCFSCYSVANSHGWLNVCIDQVEQNIPLCILEVNLFPIMVNTYM